VTPEEPATPKPEPDTAPPAASKQPEPSKAPGSAPPAQPAAAQTPKPAAAKPPARPRPQIHVYARQKDQHVVGDGCWCLPKVEEVDGQRIVIHKRD
jgi:hypothetical protein